MSQLTIGYVRVSTDLQDLSTDAQTGAIQRAAKYQNLPEPEIFAESAVSGSKPFAEREEGALVMERIRVAQAEGQAVTLIVPKVDRLGRDSIDVNQTVRTLDNLGVRVVFLDINVDTRTAMGKAFMQIAAIFAELELARIKERIQAALDQKRSKGELCGTVPFGWDAIETGEVSSKGVKIRKLVDNPVEREWIRKMEAMRDAGLSYGAIAKHLNAHGVPTKRSGELIHSASGHSRFACGKWQQGNVAKVLANASVRAWLDLQRGTEAA